MLYILDHLYLDLFLPFFDQRTQKAKLIAQFFIDDIAEENVAAILFMECLLNYLPAADTDETMEIGQYRSNYGG